VSVFQVPPVASLTFDIAGLVSAASKGSDLLTAGVKTFSIGQPPKHWEHELFFGLPSVLLAASAI